MIISVIISRSISNIIKSSIITTRISMSAINDVSTIGITSVTILGPCEGSFLQQLICVKRNSGL